MFKSNLFNIFNFFYKEIRKRIDLKANKKDVDDSLKEIKQLLGVDSDSSGGQSITKDIETLQDDVDSIQSDLTSVHSGMTTMSASLDVAKSDILTDKQNISKNASDISDLQKSLQSTNGKFENYVLKEDVEDMETTYLEALLNQVDAE